MIKEGFDFKCNNVLNSFLFINNYFNFPSDHQILVTTYFCTLSAAIYANRHYLMIYHKNHPEHLAKNGDGKPTVIGDVFIHPSASVHPSATVSTNQLTRLTSAGRSLNLTTTILYQINLQFCFVFVNQMFPLFFYRIR